MRISDWSSDVCSSDLQRPGAPAAAVDHLLVGEHGVLDGVPVHPAFLAVGQARLQEVEEHLLLVAIVARVAGCDLAPPVVAEPHASELLAHGVDVDRKSTRLNSSH